ncbi:hypothetical protein POM88_037267 [Heracleum sosnowskyi]|uniref:Amino acid transporter transmembrane domain-containing protein n=1 Tax=Heracleum sosnowskyi TaxID=360622 RepID=A0AAD8MD53_9APIA|nr:hypothetical protein POM88_037267 [Heracleum sosnowskyi]
MTTLSDDEQIFESQSDVAGLENEYTVGKAKLKIINAANAPLEQSKLRVLLEVTGNGQAKERCGLDLVIVLDISDSMKEQDKTIEGRAVGIILMSSGEQNRGGDAAQVKVENVPVYTFGFGTSVKDPCTLPHVLEAIARKSNGGTFSDVQNNEFSVAFAQRFLLVFMSCLAISMRKKYGKSLLTSFFLLLLKQSARKFSKQVTDTVFASTKRIGNDTEEEEVMVELPIVSYKYSENHKLKRLLLCLSFLLTKVSSLVYLVEMSEKTVSISNNHSLEISIPVQGDSKFFDYDGRLKRTGTIWTASSHIITAVIGSGVLSLAWATAQLGWIAGPTVLFLFSFVTYYTFLPVGFLLSFW